MVAIKLGVAIAASIVGLYLMSFHQGTIWFYVGLAIALAGGWTIGKSLLNGSDSR